MHGQKNYKIFDFLYLITLNNADQLQRVNLIIECHSIKFEGKDKCSNPSESSQDYIYR